MENNFDKLATALCEFQKQMHAVGKDREGYGYKYATLGKVIQFAYPKMTELGLSVSQLLDQANGTPAVTTVLLHESGQFLSGTYPIDQAGMKGVNNAQQFGAAISYARRYGLLSVLGLAAEDDDAQCLGGPPKDVKDTADKLDMTIEEKYPGTHDKDKCIDVIEKAGDMGVVGRVYKAHKARSIDEGWHEEMVDLCAVRKKEFGE